MLKKLILLIMVVLLVWLFLISVVGVGAQESISLSQQSSMQETCNIYKSSCTQIDSSQNYDSDTITQILAYAMILVGASILVINWRLSALENK